MLYAFWNIFSPFDCAYIKRCIYEWVFKENIVEKQLENSSGTVKPFVSMSSGLSLSCTSHPVQLAKMHWSITRSFPTEHFLMVHTENWWKRGAISEKTALRGGCPVCSKHMYIWGIYFLPTLLASFQSTERIVWLLRNGELRRQMLSLVVDSPTEGWAEPGAGSLRTPCTTSNEPGPGSCC